MYTGGTMIINPLSGENLYRDVITYSQLGEHRTGTDGEEITTDWIAQQLEEAGLQTSFQTFSLRQFFVRETSLMVGGQKVECFPWWYPCATGPRPIHAQLAPFETGNDLLRGRIALIKRTAMTTAAAPFRADIEDIIQHIAEAGALAVVVVIERPSKEILAINTSEQVKPWPVPVVLVGSRDELTLAVAAGNSTEVSLLVDGMDEPEGKARNAFGRYVRSNDVIVISTPKSGWFHCGGERGPGVALSLGLAHWVGQRQPRVSYWFNFNSGHELSILGMRMFLKEMAPPPSQVRCWIHLGAGIATWSYEETATGLQRWVEPGEYRIQCSNDDILSLVTNAFADIPGVKPVVDQGGGELGLALEGGYRGFGVYGGPYRFFHNPTDGPHGTAPELLEPMALALAKALQSIEALPKP